jgi:hypothetical protein
MRFMLVILAIVYILTKEILALTRQILFAYEHYFMV